MRTFRSNLMTPPRRLLRLLLRFPLPFQMPIRVPIRVPFLAQLPLLLLLVLLVLLVLLGGCSAPPRPPGVDPSDRHPANTQEAVQVQICQGDLQRARLHAKESARAANASAATLQRLIAQQRSLAQVQIQAQLQALSRLQAQAEAEAEDAQPPQTVPGNAVYTLRFAFASSQVRLAESAASALLARAKLAPLILLRGRTDANTDAPAERRLAQARAWAVRDFLIKAGIDPARIRSTYQAVGDPVADNSTPLGRSLNRRVEIEFYREVPIALDASTASP